jgi:PKD repeat protein
MEDALDEPLETITLSLSNPVNAVLSALSTATCMIGEPPPPGVAFESDSSTVGESAGTAILPLDLFGFYGGSFGVSYRYSGTAVSDVDYDASSTVYSINDMQYVNDAAIEIPIVDDELDEGDETVIVTLRQSSGFLSVPATHTLTIVDDDDEPLVASFEAEPRVGTAPLEVDFTDTSDSGLGAITGWEWDFGDGTGSTAQHPTHTYAEPGAYTVSLTVETGDGEDTEVRAGYIQVGGEGASIGVSPSVIQFGYVALGQSKVVSVTIRNDGDETLTGTAAVEAPFSIEGDAEYAIPPEGETFLNVIYTPTAAVASYDVIGLPGGGNAQVAVYGSAIAPEPEAAAGVRLNELVVWNTSGVVSANGEYVDWIELYNENDHALDISGWTLTDDDTDPDKYMLPAGTVIGPKSYLLVYASTDNAPPAGELHTGFALDEVNGGYLGLFAPLENTLTLMSEVEYPAAEEADRSYSLLEQDEKLLFDWGGGTITDLTENMQKANWRFEVYTTNTIKYGTLPDPSIRYGQYIPGEPSHQLFIDEWLFVVESYANEIVQTKNVGTIVSPVNPPAFVTVSSDVAASASVDFSNPYFVNAISNMPGHFTQFQQLFKTMHNVGGFLSVGGSVIVLETMELNLPGTLDVLTTPGITITTTEKGAIFVAGNRMGHPNYPQLKWHSQTFAHEWGHYAGVCGHPKVLDETLIMRGGFVSPQSMHPEWWFNVAINEATRKYYEGEHWWWSWERKKAPMFMSDFDAKPQIFFDQLVAAYSDDCGHLFRLKAATHSAGKRPSFGAQRRGWFNCL